MGNDSLKSTLPSLQPAGHGSNRFGRDSELFIKTRAANGVTLVADSFFTAPYKIAQPFYDADTRILNLVLMSASAGVMEGDCYRIKVHLGQASRLALHGQSYSKIHRMKQGHAMHSNTFILEEGAFFDFVQKPTIPFAESRFRSSSQCYLQNGSEFLYSEVLACGRAKRGERFAFQEFSNACRVYYQGELIFLDNQCYLPASQCLEGIGFFEGYSHQATLAYFSDKWDNKFLDELYGVLEDIQGIDFGLSTTNKFGMIFRVLGNSSDSLTKILQSLRVKIYGLKHNQCLTTIPLLAP
ncbi:MAG TPA: urease accessory protein UreD [Syntrophomonadaceae bacterium]|nr:urease accessory protein UreD [Syntrophomonadaceae bacterium]